jgi:hypothetical protein
MVFDRREDHARAVLYPTNNTFSLAGHNLLYAAWLNRGRPLNAGWHVPAAELISLHFNGARDSSTQRLIVDFHPSSKDRIGLIELLDVYAFTYGDDPEEPAWTPLMLRFRDLFYKEYGTPFDDSFKAKEIAEIDEPRTDTPDFVEFLYLKGRSWNWGRNGATNAAFLYGQAREYFGPFFCATSNQNPAPLLDPPPPA